MFAILGRSKVNDFDVKSVVDNIACVVSGALKISKIMYPVELFRRKLLDILNENSGDFYVRESKHILLSGVFQRI